MKNEKIYFFVGTLAEYIKLMPIVQVLNDRNIESYVFASGQNNIVDSEISNFLGQKIDKVITDKKIQQSPIKLASWFWKTYFSGIKAFRSSGEKLKGKMLLIHGDTISTILGAWLGKMFGMKVMHVEAGLRSYNWLRPFPEEIDRHIAGKYVHTHYCPNQWAVQNLAKYKGEKINTHGNTIIDSINIALHQQPENEKVKEILGEKYFFFTVHRQENIYNHQLLEFCVNKALELADGMKCLFILHAPTKVVLEKLGLLEKIQNHPNIILLPRVGYFDITHVLANAEFIVTDGGSNQEEGYYLGRPTLVLRNETERSEGIGRNVVISKSSPEVIEHFVENYKDYEIDPPVKTAKFSPSKIIVDDLVKNMGGNH